MILRANVLFANDVIFWYFSKKFSYCTPISTRMSTIPHEQHEDEGEVLTVEPTKVILFNDDVHSFEEVITQLMKALRCIQSKAESLAWDVHNNGKAVVYTGEIIKCMEVSHVLEEIQLMTQIEV